MEEGKVITKANGNGKHCICREMWDISTQNAAYEFDCTKHGHVTIDRRDGPGVITHLHGPSIEDIARVTEDRIRRLLEAYGFTAAKRKDDKK